MRAARRIGKHLICMILFFMILLPNGSKFLFASETGIAVLVIDVQVGHFPIHRGSFMMKNINIIKEKAKLASVPVIYIHNYDDDFIKVNSRKWELNKFIKPEGEYLLVNKEFSSSFKETELKALLESKNIGTLVITGLSTNHCVNATIQDAFRLKYKIIVVSDAHASASPNANEMVKQYNQKWEQQGAVVLKADDISF